MQETVTSYYHAWPIPCPLDSSNTMHQHNDTMLCFAQSKVPSTHKCTRQNTALLSDKVQCYHLPDSQAKLLTLVPVVGKHDVHHKV